VPFCEAKCVYCAFASAIKSPGDEELYLASLEREAALRSEEAGTLDTVYIGGGTPTALSERAWERLTETLERHFDFANDAEFTVEANPNSLTRDHIGIWRNYRVNRVSIGVQSLTDSRLAYLGRIHTAMQAQSAVARSLDAGFSVSADMMFGLPDETIRDWGRDLKSAVALGTRHISIYQLTMEPGTPLAARDTALPDGYAQYRYAQWRLPRHGLAQYEVASFARAGYESRHNLNYWSDGEYLGLGPSAWSYVGGARSKNAPTLAEYARMLESGSPEIYSERLEGEAAARQAAVLALRTAGGVDREKFADRYGEEHARAIMRDIAGFPGDLVDMDAKSVRLTAKGLRVGNAIWNEIV
jgi:oxygen-independent coproporphyrinogen-3 oxidase